MELIRKPFYNPDVVTSIVMTESEWKALLDEYWEEPAKNYGLRDEALEAWVSFTRETKIALIKEAMTQNSKDEDKRGVMKWLMQERKLLTDMLGKVIKGEL